MRISPVLRYASGSLIVFTMDVSQQCLPGPEDLSGILFDRTSAAVAVIDRNRRIKLVNPAFPAVFGHPGGVLHELPCGNALGCCHAVEENKPCGETTGCAECPIQALLCGPEAGETAKGLPAPASIALNRRFYVAGMAVHKHLKVSGSRIRRGGESLAVVLIEDLTELEDKRERLRSLSERDWVTGLLNPRLFRLVGDSLLHNALRGNIALAVLVFEINNFQDLAASRGARAGAYVLATVAALLRDNLRRSDTLTRIDTAEFALVMECPSRDIAETVTAKLYRLITGHTFEFEGDRIPVDVSMGAATELEGTLEAMLKRAEERLYRTAQKDRAPGKENLETAP